MSRAQDTLTQGFTLLILNREYLHRAVVFEATNEISGTCVQSNLGK